MRKYYKYMPYISSVYIFISANHTGPQHTNWMATASNSYFHGGYDFTPSTTIDGILVDVYGGFWSSGPQVMNWYQLDLAESYYVRAVELVNRMDDVPILPQEKYKEVRN